MKKFTSNKLRIAVCISGQLRNWNVLSKMFELYNSIHKDVQYDFFLTSWIDEDEDIANSTFITSSRLFDMDITTSQSIITESPKSNYVYFTYLLKQVHVLRNEYEHINGIVYDCVISIRPDLFISLEVLRTINIITNSNNHRMISPKLIYTKTGTVVHHDDVQREEVSGDLLDNYTLDDLFTDDAFFVGHPKTFDVFSNLYNDVFINKTEPNNGYHMGVAHYLMTKRISNQPLLSIGQFSTIRSNKIHVFEDLIKSNKLSELYNLNYDNSKYLNSI